MDTNTPGHNSSHAKVMNDRFKDKELMATLPVTKTNPGDDLMSNHMPITAREERMANAEHTKKP